MIASPGGSRELAALRQRAYGPDADIQDDPQALQRLNELEELARQPAVLPTLADADPKDASPSDAASTSVPRVETGVSSGAADAPSAEPLAGSRAVGERSGVGGGPATPAGRRPWWRSGPVWAVAAVSLVLGLVLGSAVMWLASPPVDAPDQTLALVGDSTDRSASWIGSLSSWGVDPSSVSKYESFDTLDVWVGETPQQARCLLLSHMGRIFTSSCAARGLEPLLDLTVSEGLPVHWERPMPAGTVIRFIARTDRVDVWVRHSPDSSSNAVP
ncbi:hypothetical protein [Microbacterium deminutum]|uniref:Uncharacterized protein n=1 Tax=Microbacterium deminutum TaxID=344164 RepID=A0ABN2QX79_9MICO